MKALRILLIVLVALQVLAALAGLYIVAAAGKIGMGDGTVVLAGIHVGDVIGACVMGALVTFVCAIACLFAEDGAL